MLPVTAKHSFVSHYMPKLGSLPQQAAESLLTFRWGDTEDEAHGGPAALVVDDS